AHVADLPKGLSVAEREELAWYLEEFLAFPYGAEMERAGRVEAKMEEWGGELRAALFGKGRGAKILALAAENGYSQRDLCVTSDDVQFLARPWELLHDEVKNYLAFAFRGLYRTRATEAEPAGAHLDSGEPFRVLLVVCRPYGEKDVPYGAVSRPMLDALRPLRSEIELDVLRPPTFDALLTTLQSRQYHLVHFDGHGAFPARRGGMTSMSLGAPEGLLVFEDDKGKPDPVSADRLEAVLQQSRVPFWVLNACQSAMVGDNDAIASVASRLTQAGAHAVVAMSHSVYKDAAGIFVGAFYASLARHATMSGAVGAGRRAMHANQQRDSVVGKLKLSDWIVPALYQQTKTVTPIPETVGETSVEADDYEVVRERVERLCPAGDYGFIGRDYDIQRIERVLYQKNRHVVTINGIGGTGKTELANGFARWYSETGGCPGGVFRAEFGDGTDFARVMASVFGYGTDHSARTDEEQWTRLVGYLTENACLLVWDNFETVAGYSTDAEGAAQLVQPATSDEQAQFKRLVKDLRGGLTRVLITTRKSDERWLGAAAQKVEIKGLVQRDRIELASSILDTVERTVDDFATDQAFATLLDMLGGHPRSMEVVLSLLETKQPAAVIASLEHETREGNGLEDASLEVAFNSLSEESRTHLPFLGLFVSRVHCGVLAWFVHHGDSQQKAYEKLVGASPDADGWARILDEATRHGLVRRIADAQYALHPTLPVFLRRRLRDEISGEGVEALNTEFTRFYAAFADHYFEGVERADIAAIAAVATEEANLLRALSLSLGGVPDWGFAAAVLPILADFYDKRGRGPERVALLARGFGAVGREAPEETEEERRDFWRSLAGRTARVAYGRADYTEAERLYRVFLTTLDETEGSDDEPNVAVAYHQLGIVAQDRHDYAGAETWFRKALEIEERLGLEAGAATDYHQLGILAQERQDYAGAETWFRKALDISERLG
ncbi:MAG: CHAT domain-containing protein, partial [Candidatus Poribacteria bacterium]